MWETSKTCNFKDLCEKDDFDLEILGNDYVGNRMSNSYYIFLLGL